MVTLTRGRIVGDMQRLKMARCLRIAEKKEERRERSIPSGVAAKAGQSVVDNVEDDPDDELSDSSAPHVARHLLEPQVPHLQLLDLLEDGGNRDPLGPFVSPVGPMLTAFDTVATRIGDGGRFDFFEHLRCSDPPGQANDQGLDKVLVSLQASHPFLTHANGRGVVPVLLSEALGGNAGLVPLLCVAEVADRLVKQARDVIFETDLSRVATRACEARAESGEDDTHEALFFRKVFTTPLGPVGNTVARSVSIFQR